ncbi:MAG: alpha/beta fold hydrolase [Opitutaceae bacterium]
MKTLPLSGLLLVFLLPLARAQPAATARVVSAEIGADRRVTFRLQAPKANEVSLAGEFLSGSKPLEKNANGLWSVTVGPIAPEIYYYNLTIDGVRTIDPGNPDVKTGSTPSTISSILEVRGDSPAFYDAQAVPHGEIRTHWYESKSLKSMRRLTVYTPPGYDAARDRLPVLYLLHGANADETAWTRLGRVNLILDNLIAAGKTKPFLVVMPFGYGVPPDAPAEAGKNTAQFGRDLIEDAIPYVEARYRVSPNRDRRALVGLSMGGGQAMAIGLNRLDIFSHVGVFSSGGGTAAEWPKTYGPLVADAAKTNRELRLLWIGCGTEDAAFAAAKRFSDFLNENKIKHTFRDSGGAHTWMVWRRYLNEISPALFR